MPVKQRLLSRLALIVGGYPSPAQPTRAAFVRQIVHSLARQGVHCLVVHPVAWPMAWDRQGYPTNIEEETGGGGRVQVVRPAYLSLTAREGFTHLGALNPARITFARFVAAADGAIRQAGFQPDAIYGHFLYFGGAAAVQIGQRRGLPAFPAVGEGEFWSLRAFGRERARQDLSGAAGFLANATHLRGKLAAELAISAERIGVFPNGVNLKSFCPHDRAVSRQALRLPLDRFLVGCVGSYLHEKGPARVSQAIDGLPGVGGVFAGQGPVPPMGTNVLFNQRVPHTQIPELLSACDLFVLPTLVEGCCNALIEAMACGLPIVSSQGEFTDDLLDDGMAIRVDPLDVAAIRSAVVRLRDDPALCARMSRAALKRSQQFDINDRARRVLEYIADRSPVGRIP